MLNSHLVLTQWRKDSAPEHWNWNNDESAAVFVLDADPDSRRSIHQVMASVGLETRPYAAATEFLRDYQNRPGCLVTETRLPDLSGLQVMHALRRHGGYCPPVIMVTAYGEVASAVEAMKQGVVDYLEKPAAPQVLLDQVQHALRLDRVRRKVHQRQTEFQLALSRLSEQESRVLHALTAGLSNKAVATELDLSEKTVATYRARALEKLGLSNLIDLVQRLMQCPWHCRGLSERSDVTPASSAGPIPNLRRL